MNERDAGSAKQADKGGAKRHGFLVGASKPVCKDDDYERYEGVRVNGWPEHPIGCGPFREGRKSGGQQRSEDGQSGGFGKEYGAELGHCERPEDCGDDGDCRVGGNDDVGVPHHGECNEVVESCGIEPAASGVCLVERGGYGGEVKGRAVSGLEDPADCGQVEYAVPGLGGIFGPANTADEGTNGKGKCDEHAHEGRPDCGISGDFARGLW